MAETDVLSGLLNRNSYEKNLALYPNRCKNSLACIYVDVNGLHELNNSQSHAAGDRMLQTVAHAIKDYFGDRDTYRIGGDEFVAFGKDETEEDIRKKVEKINHLLTEEGYHVSIGMCIQETPVEINSLIKQAEKRMYEAKKQYYEQIGRERMSRV